MSFHPYSVRPIGKKVFEDYLLDLFSSLHYRHQIPYEDDIQKEAAYGERIWKSEPEKYPEEALITAVVGQAVLDYIECWQRREKAKHDGDYGLEVLFNSRCLEMENDFFREYDLTEGLFNELLYQLYDTWSVNWLKGCIKRNYNRFMARIGKEED